jgi:adenylate cyclase
MMELLVTGPEPTHQRRWEIPAADAVRLGRAPRAGWAIPWDLLISREHCELLLDGSQLKVKRLDSARNPVYFQEVDTREFIIGAGQGFRIGQTLFQLVSVDFSDGVSGSHIEEHSFGPDQLKKFKFYNAEHRLEVLTKLPKAISKAGNDEELAQASIKVLLDAMKHARAVACVEYGPDATVDDKPLMMRWDSRSEDMGRFSPSRRLLFAAIERGEGVLHIWQDTDDSNPAFTVTGNLDWAFCMPFKGEASKGWCFYVTGQFGAPGATALGESDLKGDLRFTGLVADFVSSIREVNSLQKQQAGLAQFFSPTVVEAIRAGDGNKLLKPRYTDITVLFCDMRGFSKHSEKADENEEGLQALLDRVSNALGVMTAGIQKFDGVIADFQGDAALGFWGWPNEPPEGPLAACHAALYIQQQFAKSTNNPDSPLYKFNVGIGIAHGKALAGKIGPDDLIKVGAFGPVVNMGARLESMTKHLKASILIDDLTAQHVRKIAEPSEMRCRKFGQIRPYGMDKIMTVSELVPPLALRPELTDSQIGQFEAVVDLIVAGQWQQAHDQLELLPEHDVAREFLNDAIAGQDQPPSDWDGIITMKQK